MRLTRRGEMSLAFLIAVAVAATFAIVRLASDGSSGSSPSTEHPPSRSAYTQVLQRIASAEATAQQRVADGFRAKTVAALREALKTYEADQTGLATQLASLMPPADAAAANTALAHAFADSATAVHSLIGRIANAKTVAHAFLVIQSDRASHQVGKAIGAAVAQLRALGYLPEPQEP